MGNRQFSEKLRGYENAWSSGKNPEPELPAGAYTMQLEEATFHESSNSGALSVKRRWVVTEGEEQGKEVTDYLSFASDFGIRNLAEWLSKLGFTPPDAIDEVEDIVNLISNNCPIVEMRVSTAKSGSGVFLNMVRVIDAEPGTLVNPGPTEEAKVPAASRPSAGKARLAKAAPEPESETDGIQVGDEVEFDSEVEGGRDSGTVTVDHGDGAFDVETENGTYEALDESILTKLEPAKSAAPKPKAGVKPTVVIPKAGTAADEKKRRGLLSIAGTFSITESADGKIKINDKTPFAQLVEAMETFEWHEGPDNDAVAAPEATILKSCGIEVAGPPPEKAPPARRAARK